MRENGKKTESCAKIPHTVSSACRRNLLHLQVEGWSGRPDLNWGPLGPEPSALPGYATPRKSRYQISGFRCQRAVLAPETWFIGRDGQI